MKRGNVSHGLHVSDSEAVTILVNRAKADIDKQKKRQDMNRVASESDMDTFSAVSADVD